jgi:hypothetical protein
MFTSARQGKINSGSTSSSIRQNDLHEQTATEFIQTKLTIASTNDPLEKEADEMADKVMRMQMPEPISFYPKTNSINRKCAQCEEEEKLQRKESSNESFPTIPPIVHETLNSSGKEMNGDTRSFMESRFNYDFSDVKVHDDDLAAKSASSINALAYTSGNHIVFGAGQYNTATDPGKRLLAHELTHVQQQNSSFVVQRKPTLTKKDLEDIANQVHKAIEGLGTDEEAVYRALQRLERDREYIQQVDEIYQQKFKVTLEEDIRDDFSDEELQYALELIGIAPQVAQDLIGSTPSSEGDYEYAATKLYQAMKGWGTNEEAIYGVLLPMENVPERIAKLKAAYTKKYPQGLHGGDLEYDIKDEMSGSELDYALLLLNVFPLGNTAILTWIRNLINVSVKKETAEQVMNSLDKISDDRLRVIIIDLIRSGDSVKFRNTLVSIVATDFKNLTGRITSIESEFIDPAAGTTAVTANQQTKINDVLNEGMQINPVTHSVEPFVDVVAGRSYQQDVEETLEKEVTAFTPRALQRLAYPKFGWPRYEEIANEAKARTDAVFGHYAQGDALTSAVGPDRNLFDFSEKAFSDADLIQFANYLVTGHNANDPVYPGKTIHQVHNADLERDPEKTILNTALSQWFGIAGNKDRLLKINKTWSGAQSAGQIFMQRWDVGDLKQNRFQFWKMFQTMIHEYLHKITHSDYSTKANALSRTKAQVFTEGGTSYFDQRVWQTLYPDEVHSNPVLRKKVEGGDYPYDSEVIPKDSSYDQIEQFKKIVEVVGEKNAAAAYFLGKTDRIGL